MQEFKKKIMEIMNGINQDWVDAIKEANKTGTNVKSTEMFGSYSARIVELQLYQQDFEARNVVKPRKGGLWK